MMQIFICLPPDTKKQRSVLQIALDLGSYDFVRKTYGTNSLAWHIDMVMGAIERNRDDCHFQSSLPPHLPPSHFLVPVAPGLELFLDSLSSGYLSSCSSSFLSFLSANLTVFVPGLFEVLRT